MAYYLMNGKEKKGNALNLLVDGKLVRSFNDISDIDLITMKIDREKSNEIIKEYNKDANVDGVFYIASPQRDYSIKVFAPIFRFNSSEAFRKEEQFKYFTLERNRKVANKEKLKLDQDNEFENYIRSILYRVLDGNGREILDEDTLLSLKLKEVMLQRFQRYEKQSTNSFINRPEKIKFFRNILSSYTELRALTLEYLLALEKDYVWIRKDIKSRAYWDNHGMVEVPAIDYEGGKLPEGTITDYKQLTMVDLMRKKI